MEKNKFYITTAIDYLNAKPHIGHAFEKIVADVIARYKRQEDLDVYFLTGSDEHGFKMQQAAEKKGITPQQWVDDLVGEFTVFKTLFNLSYDEFVRTSDPRHKEIVQNLWMICKKRGDIYKKSYQGAYCSGCESFIKESDLVDGKCPNHGKAPDIVEEENWFFKLSNYSDKIKELIQNDEFKIFPAHRKNEILNILNEIDDFSVSRPKSKLSWGIEVPDDPEQVMYVWFDALSNYLTGIDYNLDSDKFRKYWPADLHVIGKDISRFHTIYWPAMLMSMGFELPKAVLIHGFINLNGTKISKTLGNIVYPQELVDRCGIDAARYFLLRETPTTEDGDFTWEKFDARYEADLANSLGNLVSRVTNIAEKNNVIFKELNLEKINLEEYFDEYRLDKALEKIWEKIHEANKYVDDEKPWSIKDDPEKLNLIINNLLNSIKNIGTALKPFIPETSEKILNIFKQEKIVKAEPLFPKKN